MAKKSEVEDWKNKISIAKKYKKKAVNIDRWKRYIRYYKGEFNDMMGDFPAESDKITVNLVHPNVKVFQSALAARDPVIVVSPRKEEYANKKYLMENVLNYTIKEIGYKYTLKKILRDSHIFGLGISKCGYSFETEKEKDKSSELPVYNEYIKKDSVYFLRVNPFYFYLDPNATELLTNARWCFETIFKPKEYVEKKYGIELAETNIFSEMFETILDTLGIREKEIIQQVELSEIWDIENRKRIVLAEGSDKILLEADFPDGIENSPYDILTFNEIPNEPYPISDIKLYESQQREKNFLRTMMMTHVKRFNRRYQIQEGTISKSEMEKFEANVDGSVIQFKQPPGITPVADAPLAQDAYIYEGRIDGDVRDILGIEEMARGGGITRKTATEASIRDAYLKLRIGDRQTYVEEFVNKTATKLAQLIMANYSMERHIRILGDDGKFLYKRYTEEEIEGEYDFEVKLGSTMQQNELLENRQIMEIAVALRGNPYINQKELIELIIDTLPDSIDTTKLLIPSADQISKDPYWAEIYRQQIAQNTPPTPPGGAPPGGLPPEMTGAPVAGMQPGVAGVKRGSEIMQEGMVPGAGAGPVPGGL